jgi:predicted amidohydrolase YtcJ
VNSALVAAATLAVINARVWTGDAARPLAEAMLVSAERIIAVGSNDQIRKAISPATRVIHAGGASVTPGFIDAHLHIFRYRESRHPPLFLRFKRSRAEFVRAVADHAAALPKGTWILGYDWHESGFKGEMPSRSWIDRITRDHPVWLKRIDGDMALANAVALHLAGIESRTGLIRGGEMWRIEAALIKWNSERARRSHPDEPSLSGTGNEDDSRVVERILSRLPALGITSVHHSGGWGDLLLLKQIRDTGRLPVRVYACPQLNAWIRLRDYVNEFGNGDNWLRWDCLKGFGAMSAANCHEWISGAARSGLQVMVHVAPEPGLSGLLDIYERISREQKLSDARFRVEHAHALSADVIARFARMGVIASVQPPLLARFDAPGRVFVYPWGALRAAGVRMAFGTDSVASSGSVVSPLAAMQMALERPVGLSLDEALKAYTIHAAYAGFAEKQTGSLEPGKLADFVVFDRELKPDLRNARVRLTVAGGRVQYENHDLGGSRTGAAARAR